MSSYLPRERVETDLPDKEKVCFCCNVLSASLLADIVVSMFACTDRFPGESIQVDLDKVILIILYSKFNIKWGLSLRVYIKRIFDFAMSLKVCILVQGYRPVLPPYLLELMIEGVAR